MNCSVLKQNNWIRKRGVKSSAVKKHTYSHRLVNLVRDLVKTSDNYYFSKVSFKVLNKNGNKKDNEIDQKIDGTDDEKTTTKSIKK